MSELIATLLNVHSNKPTNDYLYHPQINVSVSPYYRNINLQKTVVNTGQATGEGTENKRL